MIRILVCSIAFLLCLTTSFAGGQVPVPNVNDGNALLRECGTALAFSEGEESAVDSKTLERGSDMGQCMGLVIGVWHTHMLMVDDFESQEAFCPPNMISAGQMARIVYTYLQEHPVELHNWDTALILDAFINNYPCR